MLLHIVVLLLVLAVVLVVAAPVQLKAAALEFKEFSAIQASKPKQVKRPMCSAATVHIVQYNN